MKTTELRTVPLAELHESPNNPRRHFDAEALQQLADNMARAGVLTPLLVRPAANGAGGYEILDGARRYRAARLAAMTELPVRVLEMTDDDALEVIVIANLQRENLHPLEEAKGYQTLLGSKTGRDAAWIAARVGRSTKYVYDRVKLLSLTKAAQQTFLEGGITAGHAVILARLKPADQERAMDLDGGGVFEGEHTLWDPRDDDAMVKEPRETRETVKPRSVRELQAWVDQHVKFEAAAADPMLFPDTVQTVTVAKETAEKVVQITQEHYVQPEARDAKERIFFPRSWKRADGGRSSKVCEHAVTGVIVVGPGRGEAFRVCVDKKRCAIHWGREQKEAAQRAKAATTGGRTGEDRHRIEQQKATEQEARRAAEDARWKQAEPAILQAVAAAVTKASARAQGLLGTILLEDLEERRQYGLRKDAKGAGDYVPRGTTAEDLVRHAVFIVLTDELRGYDAREYFPKRARAFGLDVKKIVDEAVPPLKAEAAKSGSAQKKANAAKGKPKSKRTAKTKKAA